MGCLQIGPDSPLTAHQSEGPPLQGESVVLCQCGKAYVAETQRHLETRVKEHRDACNKGDTWKSAIAEHRWDLQHQVDCDETRVLDRATRPIQLKVKEALHIEKIPNNSRLNRDGGYELQGCWITTMKKLGGGVNCAGTNCAGTATSGLYIELHECASAWATRINFRLSRP